MECKASCASMFFNSNWLQRLKEDSDREAADMRGMKRLKQEGRSVLWNVCTMLGHQSNGVPGQACQLLERYLYKLLLKYASLSDPDTRSAMLRTTKAQLVLMIACCVQLSVKMSSAEANVSASVIRTALLCKGISYSLEQIKEMEFKIFSSLDFRIPLWTSVDMGEALASALELPSNLVRAVALIVDLAEYYREAIENCVRRTANASPTPHISDGSSSSDGGDGIFVCSVQLACGAVAAAARFARFPDPSPRLALLLRLPLAYVQCLRDAIVAHTTETRKKPAILKRRRN